MNNLREFFDKASTGHAPVWVLVGAGMILFLLALKVFKGFLKLMIFVLALAALAGAVAWYLHNQGKL